MTQTYTGSCLCQAVKYQVKAIKPHMSHCHCTMCRKFHGAAYATYGEALQDHFIWLAGKEKLSSYLAPNGTTRQFCQNCGSSLTFCSANNPDGIVEFALATLDDDIPHKPDAHIFLNSKANWDNVNDELPHHAEGRASDEVKIYSLYILLCDEKILYTGIAHDPEARLIQHQSKKPPGAKFTRRFNQLTIVYQVEVGTRSEAQSLEYHVKKLNKAKKQTLIQNKLGLDALKALLNLQ